MGRLTVESLILFICMMLIRNVSMTSSLSTYPTISTKATNVAETFESINMTTEKHPDIIETSSKIESKSESLNDTYGTSNSISVTNFREPSTHKHISATRTVISSTMAKGDDLQTTAATNSDILNTSPHFIKRTSLSTIMQIVSTEVSHPSQETNTNTTESLSVSSITTSDKGDKETEIRTITTTGSESVLKNVMNLTTDSEIILHSGDSKTMSTGTPMASSFPTKVVVSSKTQGISPSSISPKSSSSNTKLVDTSTTAISTPFFTKMNTDLLTSLPHTSLTKGIFATTKLPSSESAIMSTKTTGSSEIQSGIIATNFESISQVSISPLSVSRDSTTLSPINSTVIDTVTSDILRSSSTENSVKTEIHTASVKENTELANAPLTMTNTYASTDALISSSPVTNNTGHPATEGTLTSVDFATSITLTSDKGEKQHSGTTTELEPVAENITNTNNNEALSVTASSGTISQKHLTTESSLLNGSVTKFTSSTIYLKLSTEVGNTTTAFIKNSQVPNANRQISSSQTTYSNESSTSPDRFSTEAVTLSTEITRLQSAVVTDATDYINQTPNLNTDSHRTKQPITSSSLHLQESSTTSITSSTERDISTGNSITQFVPMQNGTEFENVSHNASNLQMSTDVPKSSETHKQETSTLENASTAGNIVTPSTWRTSASGFETLTRVSPNGMNNVSHITTNTDFNTSAPVTSPSLATSTDTDINTIIPVSTALSPITTDTDVNINSQFTSSDSTTSTDIDVNTSPQIATSHSPTSTDTTPQIVSSHSPTSMDTDVNTRSQITSSHSTINTDTDANTSSQITSSNSPTSKDTDVNTSSEITTSRSTTFTDTDVNTRSQITNLHSTTSTDTDVNTITQVTPSHSLTSTDTDVNTSSQITSSHSPTSTDTDVNTNTPVTSSRSTTSKDTDVNTRSHITSSHSPTSTDTDVNTSSQITSSRSGPPTDTDVNTRSQITYSHSTTSTDTDIITSSQIISSHSTSCTDTDVNTSSQITSSHSTSYTDINVNTSSQITSSRSTTSTDTDVNTSPPVTSSRLPTSTNTDVNISSQITSSSLPTSIDTNVNTNSQTTSYRSTTSTDTDVNRGTAVISSNSPTSTPYPGRTYYEEKSTEAETTPNPGKINTAISNVNTGFENVSNLDKVTQDNPFSTISLDISTSGEKLPVSNVTTASLETTAPSKQQVEGNDRTTDVTQGQTVVSTTPLPLSSSSSSSSSSTTSSLPPLSTLFSKTETDYINTSSDTVSLGYVTPSANVNTNAGKASTGIIDITRETDSTSAKFSKTIESSTISVPTISKIISSENRTAEQKGTTDEYSRSPHTMGYTKVEFVSTKQINNIETNTVSTEEGSTSYESTERQTYFSQTTSNKPEPQGTIGQTYTQDKPSTETVTRHSTTHLPIISTETRTPPNVMVTNTTERQPSTEANSCYSSWLTVYYGPKCEHKTSTLEAYIGITFGIFGVVLMFVVIIVACTVQRRKHSRSEYKTRRNCEENNISAAGSRWSTFSGRFSTRNTPYQRSFYDKQFFVPVTDSPGRAGTGAVIKPGIYLPYNDTFGEAPEIEIDSMPSFRRIDTVTNFSIKRPKVEAEPGEIYSSSQTPYQKYENKNIVYHGYQGPYEEARTFV